MSRPFIQGDITLSQYAIFEVIMILRSNDCLLGGKNKVMQDQSVVLNKMIFPVGVITH